MLRCNRGQTDFQRWMVTCEIAPQKAIDAWLDLTTPRPDPAGAQVVAEVRRLREAAQAHLRAEARQMYIGAPAGLEAHVNTIGLPDATDAMSEAAGETVESHSNSTNWSVSFPMSDSLAALMALVMSDLSESQRKTLMNLIFQRGVDPHNTYC